MRNMTDDIAAPVRGAHRTTGPILLATLALLGASACLKPLQLPPSPSDPNPRQPDVGDKYVTDSETQLPVTPCKGKDCPPLEPTAQPLAPLECPTGQCIPDNSNGQGIYIVEGSDFCFTQGTEFRFCPEAFVNRAPGDVVLKGRDRLMGTLFYTATLRGVLPGQLGRTPQGAPASFVAIHSVQGQGDQLVVNYCQSRTKCSKPEDIQTLQGPALAGFTFDVLFRNVPDEETFFEFQLVPLGADQLLPPFQLQKYEVRHRLRDPNGNHPAWTNPCGGSARGRVGILPGRVVDDMNAAVTADANVTTLGCESGAIVTCLDWGYSPWNPQTGVSDPNREYVYGSCLQAKRAAYFVGKGDLKSYTLTGTRIVKRDEYGFGRDAEGGIERTDFLEALWSPEGAVCLNPEHRRHPEIPLHPEHGPRIERCEAPSGQLILWRDNGKLATGLPPRH
ncbi:hypothetical protein HUA74_37825 [Myxococcus sp. CA051A]|uniref:ADYC domain-containing protein n=3 Tax=unclassified Myxococcus TaxID=2648731 RepID=UPI00157B633A|nr:ADYC domain-containing protein [Myxococcus sp. CA051A]NTX66434.1 hypothetical protein [Myxococcus sp. CA051A]